MSIFDQRGQTVTYQTNVAMGNAVGEVADREGLRRALDEMMRTTRKAYGDEQIPEAEWEEVRENLKLAKTEAEAATPDKSKLVVLLNGAKNAVKDVVAVAGLYEALSKLAEKIPHLPF